MKDNNSLPQKVDKNNDEKDDIVEIGTGLAATESARISTEAAAKKFAKPETYDRTLLDNGTAKKNIKLNAFNSGVTVKDPYTGDILVLTKAEAKMMYGSEWTKHLAEVDHIIALKKRHNMTKDNPWLTVEDVRNSSNSTDNLEVVARKYNNAKRSRSNSEFVTDEEYLKDKGITLSEDGKSKAIEREKQAQKKLAKQDTKSSVKNIAKTGHDAGKAAATSAGTMTAAMSGIINLTAVIKGEKDAKTAIVDTATDTGKAAVTGYAMGSGLTTVAHTLSSSKSPFIKALSESNVPGKIITAVIITGDTIKKYADGKITTQECLLELGEKGISVVTTGYAMTVGQALIPIPVLGAAIGALVGSALTSDAYRGLMEYLNNKELEHQERLRIIAECEQLAKQERQYRAELEIYLENYFKEYRECFSTALSVIDDAFVQKNSEGIIVGANQITEKLGGEVKYKTVKEARKFIFSNEPDYF